MFTEHLHSVYIPLTVWWWDAEVVDEPFGLKATSMHNCALDVRQVPVDISNQVDSSVSGG